MINLRIRFKSLLLLAVVLCSLPYKSLVTADEFFEKKVRPLLVAKCYQCHSGTKSAGGLSLDSRQGWEKGGDSGPAINPGDLEKSLLIQAINYQGLEMPPADKGGPLTKDEIAILTKWVESGAQDPRISAEQIGGMSKAQAETWWSYQAIHKASTTKSTDRIDGFVRAQLDQVGLTPSATADRRNLIRRATYDLTGLPPRYDDVVDFVNDASPDAFGKVIDRLLDSPQYGEHWGRHWLDVVRYADTAGENSDRPLPHIWRYRNWVIEALNQDMPFDRFVQQQLSGDLAPLDDTTASKSNGIIATGYLAVARRYGHDINKDVHLMYEDIIDNLGKSMLGMTLGCARCHDHKYDPVSAADYYALYGIFSSTQFSFPGCEPIPHPSGLYNLIPDDIAATRQAEYDAAMAKYKAQQPNSPEEIARLKAEYAKHYEVIATKNIGEAGNEKLSPHLGENAIRKLRKGEIIQIAVLRNGNYGADTTQIEIEFENIDAPEKRWSSDELITLMDSDSPSIEIRGATWSFLDVTNGPKFLVDKRTDIGANPALRGWATGDNPSYFSNVSETPVSVWTTLPPKALFTHPGPNEDSGLSWVCPADGNYKISGFVKDAHPIPGGDGVSFRIEHFNDPTLGPQLIAFSKNNGDLVPPTQPVLPVAFAVSEGDVADAKLHERGDPELEGEIIFRRWLDVFGGNKLVNPEQSGRQELSDWITSHPLFSRTIANRIWQWHFGKGIVTTPNDLGSRGAPPSHPQLLEFLCQQLIAHDYQLKPIHRLIMLSETYQQDSLASEKSRNVDPGNQLLSYYSPRRLTAEEIRDSLLAVSGQLDTSPGQAHPFPAEATWTFSQHAPFNAVYATTKRSVYMMVQRQRRHPFLALFDGPDPNTSTAVRNQTTVPPQALYFLNDEFFHHASVKTADRLLVTEESQTIADELYQRLYQRVPTEKESELTYQFYDNYPGSPKDKWAAFTRALLASNEFLYVD